MVPALPPMARVHPNLLPTTPISLTKLFVQHMLHPETPTITDTLKACALVDLKCGKAKQVIITSRDIVKY